MNKIFMVIHLRPHNVRFLRDYIRNRVNPFRPEYRIMRGDLTKVFGIEFVSMLEQVSEYLVQSPHEKVKIVEGTDVICSFCPFREDCARGEYPRNERLKRRISLEEFPDPEEADSDEIRFGGLVMGKEYTVNGLLL